MYESCLLVIQMMPCHHIKSVTVGDVVSPDIRRIIISPEGKKLPHGSRFSRGASTDQRKPFVFALLFGSVKFTQTYPVDLDFCRAFGMNPD